MRFGKPVEKKAAVPEEVARLLPAASPSTSTSDTGGLLAETCAQDSDGKVLAPRSCFVQVQYHSVQNWGGRHENEDRVMNFPDELQQSDCRLGFHMVGVLDGHDTEIASDMVSSRLPIEVGRRLKQGSSVVEAYTSAMAELENQLKALHSSAGTCVLGCTIAGRSLWCANLGDCRACLVSLAVPDSTTGTSSAQAPMKPKVEKAIWMSIDHKASSETERVRIQRAGGQVHDGRVEGLEPSRTLGDFDVKAQTAPGVISIVPEVRRHDFVPNGATPAQAVLVCATDGVWDVLSVQDVCNLVIARKEICKLQTEMAAESPNADKQVLKLLAEDLVQFSIAKGSRDDCTAITAFISVPGEDARGPGGLRRNESL